MEILLEYLEIFNNVIIVVLYHISNDFNNLLGVVSIFHDLFPYLIMVKTQESSISINRIRNFYSLSTS